MTTQNQVIVSLNDSQHRSVGTTRVVEGATCLFIANSYGKFHIEYKKYTSDYSKRSDRPWCVGSKRYGTLDNAVRALFAKGFVSIEVAQ